MVEPCPVSSQCFDDGLLFLVLLAAVEPVAPAVSFIFQLLDDFVGVVEVPLDVGEVDDEEVSRSELSFEHHVEREVLGEGEDEAEWDTWFVGFTSLVVERVETGEDDLIKHLHFLSKIKNGRNDTRIRILDFNINHEGTRSLLKDLKGLCQQWDLSLCRLKLVFLQFAVREFSYVNGLVLSVWGRGE